MSRAWELFRDADVGLPSEGTRRRATGVRRVSGPDGFLVQRREDIAASAAGTLASACSRAEVLDAIMRILVPTVADLALIFDRGPRLDALPEIATTYPLRREKLECLGSLSSAAVQARLGVFRALVTGRVQRGAESAFACTADSVGDASGQGDRVGSIVPFEVVSLPIVEGDIIRVVLSLARTRAGAPFRHADIELAAFLCTLAAQGLIALRNETCEDATVRRSSRCCTN